MTKGCFFRTTLNSSHWANANITQVYEKWTNKSLVTSAVENSPIRNECWSTWHSRSDLTWVLFELFLVEPHLELLTMQFVFCAHPHQCKICNFPQMTIWSGIVVHKQFSDPYSSILSNHRVEQQCKTCDI